MTYDQWKCSDPNDRGFYDKADGEPEAICGNCDSWKEDLNGDHHCMNGQSNLETLLTDYNDHCAKFFPDPGRWPDADHD